MVNGLTKKIILAITAVVIAVMAYLVHSPKFFPSANRPKIEKTAKAPVSQSKVVKRKNVKIAIKTEKKPIIKMLFKKRPKSRLEYMSMGGDKKKLQTPVNLANSNKQKIKIGVSLPLSGEGAIWGNALKQSIEMAAAEIPFDTKYDYDIIIKDSNNGKSSLVNLKDLVEEKKADALLSAYNEDALIAASISEKNKVPHITCAFGSEIVKQHKYTINHFPTPEIEVKALLNNLEESNIKIFSIIATNKSYILEIMEELKKQAKKRNFQIVSENIIENDTKDFSEQIGVLQNKSPEAVMVMLETKEMEIFARELNKKHDKFIYTSIDLLSYFSNKGLFNGASFVMASNGDFKFKEDFRNKTVLQIPLCGPNLYDAVKMFAVAYESVDKSEKPKGKEIISKLKKIKKFPSATGQETNVSKDGTIASPMFEMKIDQGLLQYK